MSRTKLSSLLLPFLLAACGGNVVVDGSSGAGTPGAGGSASTSAGAGGAVLATSSSTGAGGSTSASCGTTGAFFQLVINGVPLSLTSSCADFAPLPVPFGREEYGSGPGAGLLIEGCVTSAATSPGLSIGAEHAYEPGTFPVQYFRYTGPGDVVSTGVPTSGSLEVDQLDPVGGTITGSFQLSVPMPGGASNVTLVGKFAVCRAPDIDTN